MVFSEAVFYLPEHEIMGLSLPLLKKSSLDPFMYWTKLLFIDNKCEVGALTVVCSPLDTLCINNGNANHIHDFIHATSHLQYMN